MKYKKDIFKETLVIVFSGLAINYPIGILMAWFLLGYMDITDPITYATVSTVGFTFVAMIRVYTVRYYSEQNKSK